MQLAILFSANIQVCRGGTATWNMIPFAGFTTSDQRVGGSRLDRMTALRIQDESESITSITSHQDALLCSSKFYPYFLPTRNNMTEALANPLRITCAHEPAGTTDEENKLLFGLD